MIPPFNHNNVLPPFIGDINNPDNLSPYTCDIMELCRFFATTPTRIAILKGLVRFRLSCVENGISGRQWVDGDFVENIEAENREPENVVVVSLIYRKENDEYRRILDAFPEFADGKLSRQNYKVDHRAFVINLSPEYTVQYSKHWNMVYGHNEKGVWKGMLEMPLYENDAFDQMAMNYLNTL